MSDHRFGFEVFCFFFFFSCFLFLLCLYDAYTPYIAF